MTDASETVEVDVPRSADVRAAVEGFLDEVGAWAGACVEELSDAPATDVHDQGTFTTAWEAYIAARRGAPPAERALAFMKALRDATREHFTATGQWRHGYWRIQEAHHGTEHFELFLGALWRLDRSDGETVRQLLDAAEHMGNWVADVPAWFDWDSGLFRSIFLGTDGVRLPDGPAINVPDHLRCTSICLLAWRMSGRQRYLDLSERHVGRWADAIVEAGELPAALSPGGGLPRLDAEVERQYRAFARQAPRMSEPIDRAENILASAGVDNLLALWKVTGQRRFRAAGERVLDVLADALGDPDAGAAADAIRTFRRVTGDGRYDRAILSAADPLDPFAFDRLALRLGPVREGRASGIGKRSDMLEWLEDGRPRRCNPILLSAAAELRGDGRLAGRAIDLARAYLSAARALLPHGREHGCSARTVSAVARGHGRENGAGVVTGVLAPPLEAFAAGR